MSAAASRDDAHAEFARHINRLGHCLSRDHKAEGILPVERTDHRRNTLDLQIRTRVDKPAPNPFEITRQGLEPMGIDAAQVGQHQTT